MTAAETPLACPEHGPAGDPQHRFCEACGRDLRSGAPRPPLGGEPAGPEAVGRPWLSSRSTAAACEGCGTAYAGGEAHCGVCGRRRPIGRDRAELDLAGVAAVTDRARRRRNEDAVAIGRLGGAAVAVVCDGVSTSVRADAASHAAVEAGIAAVLSALTAGADPAAASGAGARAAALAARGVAEAADRDSPSCTYVSAIVAGAAVTVGWIGDSRAYWLDSMARASSCLTIDDSVAGRRAAGRPVPAGAGGDPNSRALLRWLGADSEDSEPQVVTLRPERPGHVVVCSDGLSHYLSEAAAMAGAASGAGDSPIELARHLTAAALAAGGHDNVAVAVLPVRSADPPGGLSR